MDKKTPGKKKPAKKNTTRNKVSATKSKTTTAKTRRSAKPKTEKVASKPAVRVIKARKVSTKKVEPKKKPIAKSVSRSRRRVIPASTNNRNEVTPKPEVQKNVTKKMEPQVQKIAPRKPKEIKEKVNKIHTPQPNISNKSNTSISNKPTVSNNSNQKSSNNESLVTINQNVAVLIDGNNIEKSIHSLFKTKSAMLDFDNVIPKLLRKRGLNRLIYFREGLHISSKLAERLHKNYFGTVVPCHKSADIPLSITATQLADKVDTIIILSGDSDYVDLVRHLRSRGVRVEIAAIKQTTAKILVDEADFFTEITKTDCYVR